MTSLTPSPDGRLLVSTDRDRKARVSVSPKDPLQVRAVRIESLGYKFACYVRFNSLDLTLAIDNEGYVNLVCT